MNNNNGTITITVVLQSKKTCIAGPPYYVWVGRVAQANLHWSQSQLLAPLAAYIQPWNLV